MFDSSGEQQIQNFVEFFSRHQWFALDAEKSDEEGDFLVQRPAAEDQKAVQLDEGIPVHQGLLGDPHPNGSQNLVLQVLAVVVDGGAVDSEVVQGNPEILQVLLFEFEIDGRRVRQFELLRHFGVGPNPEDLADVLLVTIFEHQGGLLLFALLLSFFKHHDAREF